MSLLDTLEGFTGALREAGVPAGTSEVLDATRVLGAIDLLDRPQLRAGLAAALVKRSVHRPAFDLLTGEEEGRRHARLAQDLEH